jgi:hypothetical protein
MLFYVERPAVARLAASHPSLGYKYSCCIYVAAVDLIKKQDIWVL